MEAPNAHPKTALLPAAEKSGHAGTGRLRSAALPELRLFAPGERKDALRLARETPLDALELAGMAAGLVVVTALTRYAIAGASLGAGLVIALANFVVALPLLLIFLGPFHLRRLRRGLRAQLRRGERS